MTIPERLVKVREKYGYTRKRLAEELGRPYRTITKYENGEREPGHEYIIEIAKKFNVTTDYLLGTSETENEIGEQKTPSYSDEAIKLAQDYDGKMDDWGRKQVRDVADNEIARYMAEQQAQDAVIQEQKQKTEVAEPGKRPMVPAAARGGGVSEIEGGYLDELPESESIPL